MAANVLLFLLNNIGKLKQMCIHSRSNSTWQFWKMLFQS